MYWKVVAYLILFVNVINFIQKRVSFLPMDKGEIHLAVANSQQ